LIREPLVHFLILGGMLFAIQSVLEMRKIEEATSPSSVIRITVADADWLKEMWARQWRRAPSNEEFIGLITDHLKEEVLAREARALQLDVGDTVVRRRLAQKMAFLLEDTVRTSEPAEAELRALYDARPDLAAVPARVSFKHLFFSGQEGNDTAARLILATVPDAPVGSEPTGDRFLLGDEFVDQDEQSLTSMFGATFARAAFATERDRWSGPVHSDYGVHLVKVTEIQPSRSRPFGEVRERLTQEWQRQRQETAMEQLHAGLMRKYRIVADPVVRPFVPPHSGNTGTTR
jgi:hypothetical protein